MIKAFPKIFTIDQKYTENLFNGQVEITEKIDGSQIGFGKINNELIVRSKGKIQEIECPDKLFNEGIEYIKSIQSKLPNNMMIYGEYMKKNKHNTLCYNRIPKNHIILFGCSNEKQEFFHYDVLQDLAYALDVEVVPLIFKGKIDNPDQIKELLNKESILGKSKIEGVVVKNYNETLLLGGQVIPILCGKYVSEEFKEIHQKNWKRENTGKGKWQTYKEGFQTEARWLKALYYLRDQGELSNSPKDIGKLMKRVNEDITEECKENIKNFLWKEFGKEVLKTATKGIPSWYKEYLLKQSFDK